MAWLEIPSSVITLDLLAGTERVFHAFLPGKVGWITADIPRRGEDPLQAPFTSIPNPFPK